MHHAYPGSSLLRPQATTTMQAVRPVPRIILSRHLYGGVRRHATTCGAEGAVGSSITAMEAHGLRQPTHHMARLQNGITMHFATYGSGPVAVVMCHGFPGVTRGATSAAHPAHDITQSHTIVVVWHARTNWMRWLARAGYFVAPTSGGYSRGGLSSHCARHEGLWRHRRTGRRGSLLDEVLDWRYGGVAGPPSTTTCR